jgi:tight adherence protein C
VTISQWIYLGIVFSAVFGVCLVIFLQLAPNRVKNRLEKFVQPEATIETGAMADWVETVVRLTSPLAKLSVPEEGWENSPLRLRFIRAGYRGSSVVPLFFATKTLLALGLPALLFVYIGLSNADITGPKLLAFILFLAAFGYYLPNGILERLIERRKLEIFENFPDAIDLMLVCVEAGLGLDAALARVGTEIQIKSKILAEELHLVNLELRAGNSREKALRNLAMRTGIFEVETLVSMLVQADRFGTSIAESLRVHADDLRTKRRMRAEEAAAKIPLKLLFPLIFCIFPSMLLVLLGPAFLQIHRYLLPAFSGGG